MENQDNYLFLRYPVQSTNEILLEFEYFYNSSIHYFYSFLRPLDESLEAFFKKINTKITKIKYKKCPKKMKNQPTVDSCDIKALDSETLKETPISDMSIKSLISSNISIQINETVYKVYVNPPWIKSCVIPKVCMVNCPIYPTLEIENIEIEDLKLVWFVAKSKTSTDWKEVHSGTIFTPSRELVDLYIKLEVTSSLNISQQFVRTISSTAIQNYSQMHYQISKMMEKMSLLDSEENFRICTYNILSHIYADTKQAKTVLYRHCEPQFLSRDYRQCLITIELLQNHSDIIFLQEVDQLFFHKSLLPILKMSGYQGIYQNKSKNNLEGPAIFWNVNKFRLIENISVPCISSELASESCVTFMEINDFLKKNERIYDRWQSLGQCMTGCVLETISLQTNKRLILSNNHLFFHPQYEVIRLFQVNVVLTKIEKIKTKFPESIVIVGGDFNASYEDESMRFIFDNNIEFFLANHSIKLQHKLGQLESAFRDVVEFTNFTPDYVGILDHIIYDSSRLKVVKAHSILSRTEVLENTALPNQYHPSDHLPLYCDVAFI